MKINGLHAAMIAGSRDRKTLSGAIKGSKMNSMFWKLIDPVLKKSEVDPDWIVKNGGELLKRKNGDPKTAWSVWAVEKVIVKWINNLPEKN